MYHAIIRRRVQQLFEAVNRGDAQPVLDAFASEFEHSFLGETALGGRRHSLAATRAWYERLFRLLPDIHFDVEKVTVSGAPWNTLAIAEWRESNSGTDGIRTTNRGIHAVEIKWGRMTRLFICPDTVALAATLDRLAAAGHPDAHAPMIVD